MTNVITRRAERLVSTDIVAELEARQVAAVRRLCEQGVIPHLGVILATGHDGVVDGPSVRYVGRKEEHGQRIGARSTIIRCGRDAVTGAIRALNDDSSVHGAMVHLPLPSFPGESRGLLEQRTRARLAHIHPAKDVDGMRPENPGFPAATPAAVMRLLRHQKRIPLAPGSRALVIGSEGYSIGRHMEPLLLKEGIKPVKHDAALYDHEPSAQELEEDLRAKLSEVDIVVACVGRRRLIKPDMLHDGMVIMDAGLTFEDGELHGDLDPSIADAELDILYTGPRQGVGLVTGSELWQNTIDAARMTVG